ncbi:MAG TPA: CHAT domain-containing protein [Blastocatellia bacterium]|nr:CHAT domain-containing protein [Blastocatellia bacterium]
MLEPGAPVEKELAGGQSHTFRVSVESGQFLRVIVEQQGIDVAVELRAPDDQALAAMDGPFGRRGPESLSIIAVSAGDYSIKVSPVSQTAQAGRYRIWIQEMRAPAPADNSRINGERAFAEARKSGFRRSADNQYAALEKYNQALTFWEQAGDRYEQARVLYGLGEFYFLINKARDSVTRLSRALNLQQQLGDRWGEAYTRTLLARVYGDIQLDLALEHANRALAYWEEAGEELNRALSLNILGGIYQSMGNPDEARRHWTQALEIRRARQDRMGEAVSLNNFGTLSDALGEPQQALQYYSQSLAILDSFSSPSPGQLLMRANALGNIGYAYMALGEFDRAVEYSSRALDLAMQIGHARTQAQSLLNLGDAHFEMGHTQEAMERYNLALPMAVELEDTWKQGYILTSRGRAYAKMGNYTQAMADYNQAYELQKSNGNLFGQADILNKRGQAYAALGSLELALEQYRQALALWQILKDARGEAASLYGIAQVEGQLGNLAEACKNIDRAIARIEELRFKVASPQLRSAYLASIRDSYELDVDLRMRSHKIDPSGGHQASAFYASERARARSLLEALAESNEDIRRGVEPSLIKRERLLQQQVNIKAERHMQAQRGSFSEKERAAAARDLDDALEQYGRVQAEIRTKSPAYAALTQPQPVSLSEAQNSLLDDDTLLLEYSLGDARSYLWAVSRSSVSSYELPARKEIEDAARSVYESLTARQPVKDDTPRTRSERVAASDARYAEGAARLSRMLLGPVASQLGTRRLVVVSEGALQYVPFESLPAPAGGPFRPLMVDHEISYLASASVLAVLRKEAPKRKPAEKAVAVIADPVYEPDDPRVEEAKLARKKKDEPAPEEIAGDTGQQEKHGQGEAGSVPRSAPDVVTGGAEFQMSRLAYSGEEGRAIRALAPGTKSLLVTGLSASRRLAESEELNRYGIIHFAAHGIVNNKNPELSGIVLSLVDERGRPQDGFLRLHDIYNLKLTADLVVLSACDTGLGKNIRGEGLVGLTRGFMYAGARQVIASLWKVDDEATAFLMSIFYRNMLREGMKPSAALRSAKVEVSKQKRWSAPYYWAAFVLQGDWK